MKCKEIREKLGDYVYHDLPLHEHREIKLHLAGCYRCKEAHEGLREVVAECRRVLRNPRPLNQAESLFRLLCLDNNAVMARKGLAALLPKWPGKSPAQIFGRFVAAAMLLIVFNLTGPVKDGRARLSGAIAQQVAFQDEEALKQNRIAALQPTVSWRLEIEKEMRV